MSKKKFFEHYAKQIMLLMAATKHKKNKAVFISFAGKTYSDNPKAISEKLHKASPKTEIVWIFNEPEKMKSIVPGYVRCVDNKHRTVMKELCDSKIWVNSFLFSPFLYKSKKQMYIQTWHGDRAFKKILFDRVGKYSKYDKLFEEKNCDYILTGSAFGEKMYRTAFRYTGEFLKAGCPRNDKLINHTQDDITKVKKELGIDENVNILLYAPTFRENSGLKDGKQIVQEIDLKQTLNTLENKYKKQWVCLVRAHKSGNGLTGVDYDDKIIDATDYQDMADLLMASDFLITDYSSSYSDFILKTAPAVLYQDDRASYLEGEREFYYDIDKTPFWVAQNQKELIDIIENITEEKIVENCKAVSEFYGIYEDGTASEKVVEKILDFLK